MKDNLLVPMIILIIMLGVLIFVMILRGGRNRQSGLDKKVYQTAWLKLENGLTRNNPASFEVAVIGADKLFDQAMRESGWSGENFGERLKNSGHKLPKNDLDGVWQAHKLRNRIAHETNVKVSYPQTKAALNGFKRGLKDLGAI